MFCKHKGLLKVFASVRYTGDLLQKIFEKFRKYFYLNFLKKFFFEMFSVERDGLFVVSSWGRMVFEIYAYPSGYFLAL